MLLVDAKLKEKLRYDAMSGKLYHAYISLEKENDRIALSIAKIHSKESRSAYEHGEIPFVNLEKSDDLSIKDYLKIIDYPKTNPARDFFLFIDSLIDFEAELQIKNIEQKALTAKIDFCLEVCKQAVRNGQLAARQFFNMCKKGPGLSQSN